MKTYYGNYLGLVITGGDKDPSGRGRCQVYIPHIMPALYEGWNKEGKDLSFDIVGEGLPTALDQKIVLRLKKILPWAECATPIVGNSSSVYINSAGGASESVRNSPAVITNPEDPGSPPLDTSEIPTGWKAEDKTRTEFGTSGYPTSVPGKRIVSLDFNSTEGAEKAGILIVVPNDATSEEIKIAESWVKETKAFVESHDYGEDYPIQKNTVSGVIKRSDNKSGMTGYFHTEPFFRENQKAVDIFAEHSAEYAGIVARTLGKIPGVTFINPHEIDGNQGADLNYNGTTYSESIFSSKFLMPTLKGLQNIALASSTENSSAIETSTPAINTSNDGGSEAGFEANGAISFGAGAATNFNQERGDTGHVTPWGAAFDPNLPNIGMFSFSLGDLSETQLGKSLISQGVLTETKDSTYINNSKKGGYYGVGGTKDKDGIFYTISKPLYAQFKYNGKTYGTIVNDVGSALGNRKIGNANNPSDPNRLFDINAEGSLQGVLNSGGNNVYGIENFAVIGAYEDGMPLNEVGSDQTVAGATPVEGAETAATASVTQHPTRDPGQSGPDTNYQANGLFGYASAGAMVWCFFREGDPLYPVYFAASYGAGEWQQIYNHNSEGVGAGKSPAGALDGTEKMCLNLNAGGMQSTQIFPDNAEGLEPGTAFEVFGKDGSNLLFANGFTQLHSAYNHNQRVSGDFHEITEANKEQRVRGDCNNYIEQDLIITVGNWSQEAIDAAEKIQEIINEGMKIMSDAGVA